MSRYICFRCLKNSVRHDGDWCAPCNREVGMPILHRLLADKRLSKPKPKKDPTQNADFALAFEEGEETP